MEIINYPIKPEKEKAWHYKSHPYFTKQAHNVVSAYIEHYSKKGDTILDPFGGTGVTAIEALRLRRKAIVIDTNPLACFLAKQTCWKVDTNKLATTFSDLEHKVKNDIENYSMLSDSEARKELEIKKFWFPKNVKLGKSSNTTYVEDLFTPRQLLIYAYLLEEIKKISDIEMQEMMKYVFSSTMAKVNLTYLDNPNRGANGGGPAIFGAYDYWIPSKIVELPVWRNFTKKFEYILKGKKKWNDLLNGYEANENLQVIHGSALEISKYIPLDSVDYVYTDPPYGHNIAYLDLSTMWNAWLFPEIIDKQLNILLEQECIEGGSLQKTQATYEELFTKSFEEIGKVLKKDGWLSCVFAHKKFEFWNTIVEACENNGMELKGSVYQPQSNGSLNYKKNPANVLCSQRIGNFKKTFVKPVRQKPDDLQKFILNEVERACLEMNGATLDMIYNRVVDKLTDNLLNIEAKKRSYTSSNKLNNLLESQDNIFYDSASNLYYVRGRKDEDEIRRQYYANKDELRIYLRELLIKNKAMTIDEIHKELFDIFAEDKKFPIEKDLPILLNEIAFQSTKTGNWMLKQSSPITLDFGKAIEKKRLLKIKSNKHTHSEIIFRLVEIGKYLGFQTWIGKREQISDSFQGIKFSEISLPTFPIMQNITESQKSKIQQIDVIWIDKLGFPRYAFEIEESTTIISGFERFMNLLDVQHDIAQKLFIVAPKSREKKLNDVFRNSTYIRHPIYLENKVQYLFKEDLINFYDNHTDKDFTENDLKILFGSVQI
ncbi:DNA methyltransferase [Thermoflexibacter ruber]|uniref:DNA methylase n=1 Tax=Thermoflexibacter ruber TaxID=1003 RepID=A0A1I2AHQ9_9BACT|nr:DNA methyltransferase [Thermoflexibacter ruber]SFE42370.1 DNA methylase [Thermoflexibacter ruber]